MATLKNGSIPTTSLRRTTLGVSLRSAAASSADRLAKAFERDLGVKLTATDGYRSLAEQQRIFLDRYTVQWIGGGYYGDVRWYRGKRYVRKRGTAAAAIPGNSNHGWGLALDLASGVNTGKGKAWEWVRAHGPAYGWTNTEGASIGEPWHWVYDPARDQHRRVTVTTTARLNVRAKPSTSSAVVKTLAKGTKVSVLALYRKKAGGVTWLKTSAGHYISAAYVKGL